jgi:hypothetical protein
LDGPSFGIGTRSVASTSTELSLAFFFMVGFEEPISNSQPGRLLDLVPFASAVQSLEEFIVLSDSLVDATTPIQVAACISSLYHGRNPSQRGH